VTGDLDLAQLERLTRVERALWENTCRTDLTAWTIEALDPLDQRPARHHRLLLRHLQRVATGEIDRLLVLMPPGSAKSTYCSVLFPAWMFAQRANLDVIGASHAADLAESFSARTQGYVRQNPSILRYGLRTENVKGWRTTNGGFYRAASVGGSITGRRSDVTLIDDPLRGAADAESETIRQGIWDWYQAEVYTRQKPGSRIVVVMTRWHPDDLGGRLLQASESGGDKWTVLKLPAICDSLEDPLHRPIGAALWPEWQDEAALARIRANVEEYVWGCTPAETPVLMADWTMKPISEVRVGDRIIGFEQGDLKARARIIEASVTHTQSRLAQVCELVMESGRKVRCTADHRWFTGRKEPGRKTYDEPKVGRRLMLAYDPLPSCAPDDQRLWDYLAGIVDGEGHVGDSALLIDQAVPRNQPIADRIREVLDELGLTYRESRKPSVRPPWSDRITFAIGEVRDVYRKLLAYTASAKAAQMRASLLRRGHMFIRDQDRVEEIRPGLVQPVYALTTTTGNYIAWGYASSNSLYQQDPRPRGASFFNIDHLLIDGHGAPVPVRGDTVFAVIDSAIKTGTQHSSTGVSYFAYDSLVKPSVHLVDWDVVQIAGDLQPDWLPTVDARLEELARETGARYGSSGIFVEDKATGFLLIGQGQRRGIKVTPIDSKLTAMGKTERALSANPYVVAGDVKITESAWLKTKVHKGRSANHQIVQLTDFRVGAVDKAANDLLDTFCYGVCIARGAGGGEKKGI
jgi:hypothetical protein